MIIKNDPLLRKEIQEIINANAVNMNVGEMLMTIFNYTDIINKDDIKQYIKEGWKENEAIVNVLFDFLGFPVPIPDLYPVTEAPFIKFL